MPATATICESCEELATCKGLDGEPLCDDCLEAAGQAICADCGETCLKADIQETPDGDLWCADCVGISCTVCASCDDLVWTDAATAVTTWTQAHSGWRVLRRSSELVCSTCLAEETITCGSCAEIIYRVDSTVTRDDGRICEQCRRDYICCDECGEFVHCEDTSDNENGNYCNNCDPNSLDFHPAGFRDQNGSAEIGSARCYGVELETDECRGYDHLNGSAWGAKCDPTVAGKEFYSAILSGDDGLTVVKDWGKLAKSNRWVAGYDAGYHLHLDLRSDSDDSRFAVAYAYEKTAEVWYSFVEEHRHDTTYSHPNRWTCADIVHAESYRAFTRAGTRYNWCNINAFWDHETIEIRLHEGTCNTDAVINWVKVHTRFADWAAKLGLAGVRKALDNLNNDDKFALISRVWDDSDLTIYYGEKAQQLDHGFLTKSIGR